MDALPALRECDRALVELLRSLEPGDWNRPAVGSWSVHDVAAHLLDGNLRRLSLDRDEMSLPGPDRPLTTFEDTVGFLDRMNDEWIRAARRLSPRVISELLALTNPQVSGYFSELDPEAPARFSVDWADQASSPVWLDVARELTEKWHHQQQIRDVVGRPGLKDPRFLEPVLDTLVHAVPRAYKDVATGGLVRIRITDLPHCEWMLAGTNGRWRLGRPDRGLAAAADAEIELASDPAWRFLMKAMPASEARAKARVSGREKLVDPFFDARGVMA